MKKSPFEGFDGKRFYILNISRFVFPTFFNQRVFSIFNFAQERLFNENSCSTQGCGSGQGFIRIRPARKKTGSESDLSRKKPFPNPTPEINLIWIQIRIPSNLHLIFILFSFEIRVKKLDILLMYNYFRLRKPLFCGFP